MKKPIPPPKPVRHGLPPPPPSARKPSLPPRAHATLPPIPQLSNIEIIVDDDFPPREKSTAPGWDSELPTPRKSTDLTIYQSLLSVFDEMSHEERVDFIELGFLFKDMPAEVRRRVINALERARGKKR